MDDKPPAGLPKASTRLDGGQKVPFDRKFPTVASVTIRVTEIGSNSIEERVFKKGDVGTYIDCIQPLCDGGGFPIDKLLSEMVQKGERSREEMATCVGQERVPGRGKRLGRVKGRCPRIYRVRIDLKFKRP